MKPVRLFVLILALGVASCSAPTTPPPATPPAASASTRPFDLPGVHNLVWYAPAVLSGSQPDSPAGLDSLAATGIRTIISVDGTPPDFAAAEARGMRYVHLPIGYDTVPADRAAQIARALRDLPGPTYIHCHHGKHRSAAATSAALILLGKLTPDQARALMKQSGTSADYAGLWRCVADAKPDAAAVAAAPATFPSIVAPSPMVAAMNLSTAAESRLKALQKADWLPAGAAALESARLTESLRGLKGSPSVTNRDEEFAAMLDRSIAHATALESAIADRRPPAEKSARLQALSASCRDCHKAYRD